MAAGLKITCTLDNRKLAAVQQVLGQKVVRKVVARSLNRAGVTMRKEGAQKIRQKLRLKIGEIKESLPIRNKPRGDQPIGRQFVEIDAAARGISLSKFKPRQARGGVKVNITGKSTVISHAFLAQMKNASRGSVWIRKRVMSPGTKAKRVGRNRSELPIVKMSVTSIHTFLMQHREELQKIGQQRFGKEFASNYSHEIAKAGS